MSNFVECSRGEFIRRARMAYPFLSYEAVSKIIARGHVTPEKPEGGICVFNEKNWLELEQYIKLKSRNAWKKTNEEGRKQFQKELKK